MIRLNHVNKFFNKGRMNEIHVINETSLEFPEKGLFALTGPSGCGKTTLLNVIGGLDKFDSGEIDFDGHIIKKYTPESLDILRNHYVGYIFQNYNLVEDKTVYENIELSLQMAGLNDKKEIEERINYVLKAVGMYNYRRRNVRALSGGQQQRVAIARAISKNPKVVLADEPTGNLDANNTFEIMTIIKKISQTCLVILVSHERNLVDFYADHIIELSDGKVVEQYENQGNDSFEHKDERNIYLKDLNHDESLLESGIDRYYEKDMDENLSFQIVEVKDAIYIKANSRKKIKYLSDDTEVRLIDDHYKARQTSEALAYDYDMEQYGRIRTTGNKHSFIRFRDTLKSGFRKATSRRKFVGWMFLIAYFVISALVVYQIATFGSLTKLDETEFLYTSKDLVNVTADETLTGADIDRILQNVNGLEWSLYDQYTYVRFLYSDYYQGNVDTWVHVYPIKLSWADDTELLYGTMPTNASEIVIDKWIADYLLELKNLNDLGVTSAEELLGNTITSNNQFALPFTIVGISNTSSPTAIVFDDAYYSFVDDTPFVPYGSVADRLTITIGRDIQDDDEILMNSTMFSSSDLNDEIEIWGNTYTVVGFFDIEEADIDNIAYSDYAYSISSYEMIASNSEVESIAKSYFATDYYWYYDNSSGIYFYSDDIDQSVLDITEFDPTYVAFNAYEVQKATQMANQLQEVQQRITSILVIVVGIIVYIFFMMRSSMLSRIREIGIYRSIGATKKDIFKIFLGEIIALTTLGSLTGYLVMSLLINRVQNSLGTLIDVFYLPLHYFLAGIIFIYVINILFGMMPIFGLLRKTPAQINAKYDI